MRADSLGYPGRPSATGSPSQSATAEKDAYAEFQPSGKLPDDLFDSPKTKPKPVGGEAAWHELCEAGAVTEEDTEAVEGFVKSFETMGSVPLNAEQMHAVATMCESSQGRKPLALFGPPGTGKTVTLVEMVLQLLGKGERGEFETGTAAQGGVRILVCAPQNFTCDVFCRRLLEAGVDPHSILRMIDPRWPATRVSPDLLPCTLVDPNWAAFRLPSLEELLQYRIVICTCLAASFMLLRYDTTPGFSPVVFTHTLIDEAGQSPYPEALIPLLLLPADGGSCLAGDPRQLGPLLRSPLAARAGLGDSLLDRLIRYYRAIPQGTPARGVMCTVLVRNYRSHQRLLWLPSHLFYGDALLACAGSAQTQLPRWSQLPGRDGDSNLVIAPVYGRQRRFHESSALYNPQEAEALLALVKSLLTEQYRSPSATAAPAAAAEPDCTDAEDNLVAALLATEGANGAESKQEEETMAVPVRTNEVGVICMSRAQAICVRNLLREQGFGEVNVGTVDDFQGQEMRVIFVSSVLSHAAGGGGTHERGEATSVGFFNNPKRFNVAITRAMALLVVVGHPDMLRADHQWGHLWRYCVARGAVIGSEAEHLSALDEAAALTLGREMDTSDIPTAMAAYTSEQQARVAL